MRITCLFVRSRIERFVDEELSSRASESIRSHVARCSSCKEEVRSLYALRRAVERLRVPRHDDGFWDEQWRAIVAKAGAPGLRLRRLRTAGATARRAIFAGSLAAAAILVVAGAVLITAPDRQQAQSSTYVPYIDFHVSTIDQQVLMGDHFSNAQYVSVSYNGQ